MAVPVIDLFAGPGGLAEGFSAELDERGRPYFDVRLSLEKDEYAHKTLEMRAFVRQFSGRALPNSYYEYVAGRTTKEALFKAHWVEASKAKSEAWLVEVGPSKANEIAAKVRNALKGQKNWLLIGGPPCQAYSLVGRSRIRGESEEKYRTDHRHFLYKEYLSILAQHRPAAFVMENVKGLLSTRFEEALLVDKILADLRSPHLATTTGGIENEPEYNLFSISADATRARRIENARDFIVRAEDYGIPQKRHRIIIIGIRADITSRPTQLKKKEPVSIDRVIADLPRLRSGLSKETDSGVAWQKAIAELAHANWINDQQVDNALRKELIGRASRVSTTLGRGGPYIEQAVSPDALASWFVDRRLKGVANHQTRGHMRADLHRYFFAALFAKLNGRSPQLQEFPNGLLPAHDNVDDAITGSKFNDRFRVQIKGRPATTVVAHISKDGHYFVHYDPMQCRSLTVREAARVQTFPDNYIFEGPRTEQYRQVGNAVPPLLAKAIAKAVRPIFD